MHNSLLNHTMITTHHRFALIKSKKYYKIYNLYIYIYILSL